MREQEELFYAAFPGARAAAELRKRRREEILASLAPTARAQVREKKNTLRKFGIFFPHLPHPSSISLDIIIIIIIIIIPASSTTSRN
jgi:hypothetical protein